MAYDLATLDARLAAAEATVPALRPGCEKRVVWAGEKVRKPLSVIYVHGFSASPEEIRPVPDRVAAGLDAHLFFTRLAGHGQDGPAMGRATLAQWRADITEAFEIGRALGEAVLVMGCSTGCTLLTEALAGSAPARGAVMVSPNFGLRSRAAQAVLDLPAARTWAPWLLGRDRAFQVMSEAHAAYWTVRYPSAAVFTMAEAVRAARASRIEGIGAPALFAFSAEDTVVSPAATRAVMARWGGPVTEVPMHLGPADDPGRHLVAGDIFSPGQTDGLVAAILNWARAL